MAQHIDGPEHPVLGAVDGSGPSTCHGRSGRICNVTASDGPAWTGTNWSGNVRLVARHRHLPTSVDEVYAVVAEASQVRALGSGHTFSRVSDSGSGPPMGDLISLSAMPQTIDIDPGAGSVTVSAAVTYGELASRLSANGFALHNLASLPQISVAGAVATGTHGSGDCNGNLATAVTAINIVTGAGERVTISRDADRDIFPGALVGLGAYGVVTHLTLRIEPAYDVAQWVYEGLPWDRLVTKFDEIFASAYSVSVLIRWASPSVDSIWCKHRLNNRRAPAMPERWLGATLADGPRHPVPGMSPNACTPQLGEPGPWHLRLPHFLLDATPSVGAELQSEYFVPREHAVAAIDAMRGIGDRLAPVLHVSELRTIAADDLWLSPAYGRDSLAIHFTWADDLPGVLAVLPLIEAALDPFGPRPHWGKLFTMPAEAVARGYDRLADAGRLRSRLDPDGRFGNDFVDRFVPAVRDGA